MNTVSNEVVSVLYTGTSSTMEKEGFVRTLEDIRFLGIEIKNLSTGRHPD